MGSKLSLRERPAVATKRPTRELVAWSKTGSGQVSFDDSALSFYHPPRLDAGLPPVDLMTGFHESGFDPLKSPRSYADGMLEAIMRVERESGKRIDASIISWRGIMKDLLELSQGYKYKPLLDVDREIWVVGFDDQVFMCVCPRERLDDASRSRSDAMKKSTEEYMYSGHCFEHMATLPRPREKCTSRDIQGRYSSVPTMAERKDYSVLVETGVNDVAVVLGAEIDCITGIKDANNKLARYAELKTAFQIVDPRQEFGFEWKLLRTWIQCFLVDCNKIIYGFRDRDLRLTSIKEYRTSALPLKTPGARSAKQEVLQYYAALVKWLKAEVQDGHTYKLIHRRQGISLELEEAPLLVEGRRVAFLTNEFVDWRESLRGDKPETNSHHNLV